MLGSALQGSGDMPDGVVAMPESLAEQLEDAIYAEFKNTNAQYKTRIRSRVYNLKDAKNPELRINVLTGVISPKKLAVMSSEVSVGPKRLSFD
jgi:transcription elongation factor S-II